LWLGGDFGIDKGGLKKVLGELDVPLADEGNSDREQQ